MTTPPSIPATAALLRSLPALHACQDEDWERLAPLARIVSFPSGTIVFSEGDRHDTLYFLSGGSVRLDMQTAKHGRQTILSMGAGDLLAWSALLGDAVMTTSATVVEPTEAVAFDSQTLKPFLASCPDTGLRFMTAVAQAVSRRLLATRLQMLDLYHR